MAVADTAYEARLRPRYGVISAVAGVALFLAAVLQTVGPQPKVGEITAQLITTNKRGGLQIVAAAISALGVIGLGITLAFLFGAVRRRKPEISPGWRIGALAGSILAGIGALVYAVLITLKAHQFVTHGAQTYMQAHTLLRSTVIAGSQYLGLLGALALAVSYVLITLNAMRVGLLTRFLGYLGMTASAASVLLLGSAPALLVEILWLVSISVLLLGFWPNGDPPAWRSGEAVPWPSSSEMRQERIRAAAQTKERGRAGAPRPDATPQAEPVAAFGQPTRATTPKRKRKRRK